MRRHLVVLFVVSAVICASAPSGGLVAQVETRPEGWEGNVYFHSELNDATVTVRQKGVVISTLTVPRGMYFGIHTDQREYRREGRKHEFTGNIVVRIWEAPAVSPDANGAPLPPLAAMMASASVVLNVRDAEVTVEQ